MNIRVRTALVCGFLTGTPVAGFEFPERGWMPKEEIGALEFLQAHPDADGRGVIVAILDTGVDPGVEGLLKTSDGKVKVVDLIDATGSGDVRLGEAVAVEGENVIGKTGRTLTLGKDWECPSGEYRFGVFAGYEKFPWDLVERMKEERAVEWAKVQAEAERKMREKIAVWKDEHPEPEKWAKRNGKDLEVLLEELEKLGDSEDPGPVYDCAVWHDGERYRAVVDTDEDGDLGDEKVLTDYGVAQEWATFGGGSLLNFGINIYDEGEVLSLVIDSGMHATHVAGIVAAYYPDSPELNGVAPGAQIVSIKIGDTRIDGMETGQALTRAALAIKRLGVDLVNMSYGEPTRTPNRGQLIEKLAELVDEDGVVFCASAGNSGPALSTVGAPGGSTESIIGVGAAVTPELASQSYSLREAIATNQYTWSSRGPTKDGALGVSISAPGGAFSPVPQWGLTRSLRFNGTSMAAPNACGGIALMMSAAKQEGIPYTSGWVKRAVENTASEMPGVEVFATGRGMLQVGDAFEYLKRLGERQLAMPRFEVSVGGGRGLYLREEREVADVRRANVSVKAVFPEDAVGSAKVGFSLKCALSSDAAWLDAPAWCFLTGGRGQSFEIEVDATGLAPGVHYAEVVGVDAEATDGGALFRVPVTVVKSGDEQQQEVTLAGGEMRRWFYEVPVGATWGKLEIEAAGIADPRRAVVHAMAVLEDHPHRNVGKRSYVTLQPGKESVVTFPAIGGTTLELCFASFWSNLGEVDYACDLEFGGVVVDEGDVVYGEGDGATRLRVASLAGQEEIAPRVKFSAVERRLKPRETSVRELSGDRDVRDDGRASWELLATYGFELDEEADVRVTIPALNDRIYESAFESQLTFFRDPQGRVHGVDDAFEPAWFSLAKGKWEVVLHLRGEDKPALKKLEKLAVVLGRKHATSAAVFAGFDAALTGGAKFGTRTLGRGERAEVFVGEPEKLPSWAKAGDVLVGVVTWQDEALAGSKVGYVVRGGAEKGGGAEPGDDVFAVKLGLLGRLRAKGELEAFDALAAEMVAEKGDDLELKLEMMRRWDGDETRAEAVEYADAVLGLVSEGEVARYFGIRHDGEGEDAKKIEKEMEAKREAIREALGVRVRALAGSEAADAVKEMRQGLVRLERWTEDVEVAVREAVAKRDRQNGLRLSILRDEFTKGVMDESRFVERMEILEQEGWGHLVEREKAWDVRRFPVGTTVY